MSRDEIGYPIVLPRRDEQKKYEMGSDETIGVRMMVY